MLMQNRYIDCVDIKAVLFGVFGKLSSDASYIRISKSVSVKAGEDIDFAAV